MKSIVKRNVRSSRTASFLRFLRIRAIRVTHGYKVSRLSIFGHQGRNSGRRVPALSFVAMTLVRIARHLLLLEIINHPVSSTTGRRLDGGSTAARRFQQTFYQWSRDRSIITGRVISVSGGAERRSPKNRKSIGFPGFSLSGGSVRSRALRSRLPYRVSQFQTSGRAFYELRCARIHSFVARRGGDLWKDDFAVEAARWRHDNKYR